MNAEQKQIVERVMQLTGANFNGVIRCPVNLESSSNAIYVNGPGGSGKSYTYRCIYHLLRGNSIPVIVMASTGTCTMGFLKKKPDV